MFMLYPPLYYLYAHFLNAKGCNIHVKYYFFYRMNYAWNAFIALKHIHKVDNQACLTDKNSENGIIDSDIRLRYIIMIILLTFP